MLSEEKKKLLYHGTVIPAHPLALTAEFKLDEKKQRSLTRYYMAAGAGGVAVAVHTTQFEIREPHINLFEKVLKLASEEVENAHLDRPFLRVAGICGKTAQAENEAEIAKKYGYDMGLVSMAALGEYSEEQVLEHVRKIAELIPVFGFYLQSAIGGRVYSYDFWRSFADIPNVLGIKVAAFNRYQTLDVVRAVCASSRRDQIALYTGNDDNIIADLITPYQFEVNGAVIKKRFVGGLLGHWAVWTQKAVQLLSQVKSAIENGEDLSALLTQNVQVTDMNAAIFDPAHRFAGCIAGVHQVLYKQGLMDGIWCLNPEEKLSEGQEAEIDRVCEAYPDLIDDAFVRIFKENEDFLAR